MARFLLDPRRVEYVERRMAQLVNQDADAVRRVLVPVHEDEVTGRGVKRNRVLSVVVVQIDFLMNLLSLQPRVCLLFGAWAEQVQSVLVGVYGESLGFHIVGSMCAPMSSNPA